MDVRERLIDLDAPISITVFQNCHFRFPDVCDVYDNWSVVIFFCSRMFVMSKKIGLLLIICSLVFVMSRMVFPATGKTDPFG